VGVIVANDDSASSYNLESHPTLGNLQVGMLTPATAVDYVRVAINLEKCTKEQIHYDLWDEDAPYRYQLSHKHQKPGFASEQNRVTHAVVGAGTIFVAGVGLPLMGFSRRRGTWTVIKDIGLVSPGN
jgi:hypothetical protein